MIRDVHGRMKNIEARGIECHDKKKLKDYIESIDRALELLIYSKDRENIEKSFSEISKEFTKRAQELEVEPGLFKIQEEDDSRLHQMLVIDKEEKEYLKYESKKLIPFVTISKATAENVNEWPVLCHEISHLLYPGNEYLMYAEGYPAKSAEYFADVVSAEIIGPAYLSSLTEYFERREKDLTEPSRTHPTPASRIRAVEKRINSYDNERASELVEKTIEPLTESGIPLTIEEIKAHKSALERLRQIKGERTIDFDEMWEEYYKEDEKNTPISIMITGVLSNDSDPEKTAKTILSET